MWEIRRTDEYERRHKHFQKKHPDELQAVLDNLDTYLKARQGGVLPQQYRSTHLHDERKGLWAVDQRGKSKKKLAETRLYVYPDAASSILYLITLGLKKEQKTDLPTGWAFVRQLRAERENQDANKTNQPDSPENPGGTVPERPGDGGPPL
jgi:hypothetical protein